MLKCLNRLAFLAFGRDSRLKCMSARLRAGQGNLMSGFQESREETMTDLQLIDVIARSSMDCCPSRC